MRRFAGCVVAVLLGVLVTGATAQADTAPSLAGENFFQAGYTPGFIHASCNPSGNSTMSFTTSGTATGPYPGTYNETVTMTIGPQTNPGTGGYGFNSGPVLSAHADFTIDSAAGQVSGSKDLLMNPNASPPIGTCDSTSSDSPTLSQTCESLSGQPGSTGATQHSGGGFVTYAAVIKAPTGSFRDSGVGAFTSSDDEIDCVARSSSSGTFFEEFLSSNGVLPLTTPGHADGGGQISPSVTFGFTAYSKDDGKILGNCNVVDGKTHIHCLDATEYSQSGNQATFAGSADVNGTPTTYRITVQDNGEPGAGADTFSIVTGSGYSASGVLTRGNVQVHG